MSLDRNRLLLVDDDAAVLRAYKKMLEGRGFAVETASDGKDAIDKLKAGAYDVIVSDVSMPHMDGLEFLRNVRRHDLDVPVILMTGSPELGTAMRAFEFGAFRYVVKPVDPETLEAAVRRAMLLHDMARVKRQALEMFGSEGRRLGDRASLEARFAMGLRLLWMAYQPIVSWAEKKVFGYEALLRSQEPTLPTPVDFVDAAERLGRLPELGRTVRSRVGEDAASLPDDAKVFVNLDAGDLGDDELYRRDTALSKVSGRVVIEITERASLEGIHNVGSRVEKLRQAGFLVALDDLGAGYAGLASFAQLEPDIAKLDMSLVRGVDTQPRKQSIVRSMTRLCTELGMRVVAEGVETVSERDKLVELGCDLFQGFLFARPERGFVTPRW